MQPEVRNTSRTQVWRRNRNSEADTVTFRWTIRPSVVWGVGIRKAASL